MIWPGLILREEVTRSCRESLARGRERRAAVTTRREWEQWHTDTLRTIRGAFPQAMFERGPLNARVVSSHEFDGYRIENVLFESLPGWEVNGTVYLPPEPGHYPGVVCPTGHSTKTRPGYQQSAQVLARSGYVAISFDPPGASGEMRRLNDHFTNGLIGYLTGVWSQTHFVVDALAALDYLETRPDVDPSAGFGVTGVSGGGKTSLYAGLLDERFTAVAPVCCLSEHGAIHLTDLYTSCPEQFGHGFIAAGIDYADLVAALAPRPALVVGGKLDEVFDYRATMRLFEEVRAVYETADAGDLCALFLDEDSGHGYSVPMAVEVVGWFNRFLKGTDEPAPALTPEEVPVVPGEILLCHPGDEVNMFTVNRDEGLRLAAERPREDDPATRRARLQRQARILLGLPADMALPRVSERTPPRRCWHALVEDLVVEPAEGVCLPGVLFTHVSVKEPRPALLWLDERGRWAAFRQNGFLGWPLGLQEESCPPDRPRILSLDVSGLGSLAPDPTAYDIAGWNDIERILTYLSVANARPIMGLRVRDALAGLAALRARPDVDANRLMVGGRGVGALVALHAALLDGRVRRVVCLEMLSHYGAMTEQFPFAWQQSIIIPEVLKHYDLPEIPQALEGTNVFIINPQDAAREALAQEAAEGLYAEAIAAGMVVRCGVDGGAVAREAVAGLR